MRKRRLKFFFRNYFWDIFKYFKNKMNIYIFSDEVINLFIFLIVLLYYYFLIFILFKKLNLHIFLNKYKFIEYIY